jgi:hypothetical protein
MSIHDVAMNPIRACRFDAMDFITESRKIGSENGWGDDDSVHGTRLQELQRLQERCVFAVPPLQLLARCNFLSFLLTALCAVSCYGVSGWPNRAAGKSPAKDSLKLVNAFPSDWKTAANK